MRITCRRCGNHETFSVVLPLFVIIDVDGNGQQTDGADFGNEGAGRWIRCSECGHSWSTTRRMDLRVDVR